MEKLCQYCNVFTSVKFDSKHTAQFVNILSKQYY